MISAGLACPGGSHSAKVVPMTPLYYKVSGSGPLLLVLLAGPGDADASDGIAGQLANRYAVVSCDRRGLSRSRLDEGMDGPTIETHANDVHLLLAALTNEPAFVVGMSIGAVIGLALIARHPEQVRKLIAHEPPIADLLPEPDRTSAFRAQEQAEEIFRTEGAAAAMKRFLAITGVDFNDREPDVAPSVRTPQMAANAEFFLTHDSPSVRRYKPDMAALQRASTRIVVAAGRTSRHIWIHRAARLLADRLGTELVEFPGGHSGYAMHPRAFASRLDEVFGHPAP